MNKSLLPSAALALVAAMAVPAAAAVRTWTGGSAGNGNWSAAANWDGAAPAAGDDLVFPAGAGRLVSTNNFAAFTPFNSIQLVGTNYVLRGNGVLISNGLANASEAGTNTVAFGFRLARAQTFSNPATQAVLVLSGTVALRGWTWDVDAGGSVAVDGAITGSGALVKTGTGALMLSASNSYDGATTVAGGALIAEDNDALGLTNAGTAVSSGAVLTLRLGRQVKGEALDLAGTLAGESGPNLWSGMVTLSGTACVAVAQAADDVRLSGAIGGAGALVKSGAGTLTLSGGKTNTYGGGTRVDAGTLLLDKTVAYGAVPGDLQVGDGTGGASADVVRWAADSQLAAGGTVTVSASGLLDLAGHAETLGMLTGAGRVWLGTNGTAALGVGQGGRSGRYDGVIAGVGTVRKQGAGAWTLTGTNTLTGVTAAAGGTLVVDGWDATCPVSVSNGATLGGHGGVAGITCTSGRVAPGASPGRLISGPLNFSAATTLAVELNGRDAGTGYDQLDVQGTGHNLGDAVLELTATGLTPMEGDTYTIVNNDGTDAIAGTFAGLPEGSTVTAGGLRFRVSYAGGSGNDVVLTFTNKALKVAATAFDGGNGDGVLNSNACVQLAVMVTNASSSAMTGLSAVLAPLTPGVTVTYGSAVYPTVPAGGTATNDGPFQIFTAPGYVCGTPIDFTLSVRTSTHGSFAFPFRLTPTNGPCGAGTGPCESCPARVVSGYIGAASPVQSGRVARVFVAGGCGAPRTCPGIVNSGARRCAPHTFVNGGTGGCVNVSLTSPGDLFCVAYRGWFDPTNLCARYAGDTRYSTSGATNALDFDFDVAAGEVFVLVVSEVAAATGGPYQLTVSGGDCQPLLGLDAPGSNAVRLVWSTAGVGFDLERRVNLTTGAFQRVDSIRRTVNGLYAQDDTLDQPVQFYRLRRP